MRGMRRAIGDRECRSSASPQEVAVTSALDLTKPIPTLYEGIQFRSRLEARWARFFDALEEPWLYEPEAYDLADAGPYLPDFFLPRSRTWLEIKPISPSLAAQQSCRALCEATGDRVVLVDGPIGFWLDTQQGVWHARSGLAWLPSKDPDGAIVALENERYWPCVCPGCRRFAFAFEGNGALVCGLLGLKCGAGFEADKAYTFDDERIRIACAMANAEGFWK
jgi:hypothetical protein